MTERIVTVDGVDLCIETFGDPGDPALLLIAGMSMSMDGWDDELCERLAGRRRAERGTPERSEGGHQHSHQPRFVVRYDHRDTGRSESSPPGKPGYTHADLTADALRVLDALRVESAHLVGISMGGGISQSLAALHPDRVRTITLIATGCAGQRTDPSELPGPTDELNAFFADPGPEPDWSDPAAVVDHLVAGERHFSPTLDEQRARRAAERTVARTTDPAAMANHAFAEGGDQQAFRMVDIAVPVLVLHGDADPMFRLAHGEALATEIPDAELVVLPGVGHEVPPPHSWDVVVPAIVRHTA